MSNNVIEMLTEDELTKLKSIKIKESNEMLKFVWKICNNNMIII